MTHGQELPGCSWVATCAPWLGHGPL